MSKPYFGFDIDTDEGFAAWNALCEHQNQIKAWFEAIERKADKLFGKLWDEPFHACCSARQNADDTAVEHGFTEPADYPEYWDVVKGTLESNCCYADARTRAWFKRNGVTF